MKNTIIVTGCQRSGVSIVAGALHECGVFVGRVNKMYENTDIQKEFTKPYLDSVGIDPEGQYPLVSKRVLEVDTEWRNRISNILENQHYTGVNPFLYKDGRVLLMHDYWKALYPDALWVLVRRERKDVVRSCMKTTYMNRFDNPEWNKTHGFSNVKDAWMWWYDENKKILDEIQNTPSLDAISIYPEDMAKGNFNTFKDVVSRIGLEYRENKVQEFTNKKFEKIRKIWQGQQQQK